MSSHHQLACILAAFATIQVESFAWKSFLPHTPKILPRSSELRWSRQILHYEDGTDVLQEAVSSPRQWLESLHDGVYSVMRCDVSKDQPKQPILWGQDFHIDRIANGFKVCAQGVSEAEISRAVVQSQHMIERLVEQFLYEFLIDWQAGTTAPSSCVAMVTILWNKPFVNETSINVNGHIFSSAKASNPQVFPASIATSVALVPTGHELVDRKSENPKIKSSSWCRVRRSLEERFLLKQVMEVILADDKGEVTTLLEGLTSNLFVVYPNNELRTCNKDVLEGYARSQVIDAARDLGYNVVLSPIALAESLIWQEVFFTSSIKLVSPVSKVFIPERASGELRCIWSRDEIRPVPVSMASSIYAKLMHERFQF